MSRTAKKTGPGEIQYREYRAKPESADEKARTVEAVIASEQRVIVMDYDRWEPIEEVLLMSALEGPPDHVPLLDSHNRWSNDDVLGSTRNIKVEGEQLIGVNHFADDPRSLAIFGKVRDGHIRDNSIGYRVMAYQTVEKGGTAEVGGRTWKAREDVRLRVVTAWRVIENSITPVGADATAKMRAELRDEEKRRMTDKNKDKPADTPTAERAPGVPAAAPELEEERRARLATARRAEVMAICPPSMIGDAERLLLEGKTVEECRAELLKIHAERAAPVGTPEPAEAERKDGGEKKAPSEVEKIDKGTFLRSLLG